MSKITIFLLTIVLISISYQAKAQDELSGLHFLSTAKIAGSCGILDSMINFQSTTKMPGGDDFVARFWAVEAARRGINVQQLSEQCDKAIILYDQLWQAMDSETK